MDFLDFSDANVEVTREDILRKVSEYDIFKRYCRPFEEIDVSFCSELRVDKNPGCRIFISDKNNTLLYKDFATGQCFDCFYYVSAKFGCNYYEAINIIGNDFKIGKSTVNIDPKIVLINDEIKSIIKAPKVKSTINIVSQPFNSVDYDYWQQYGVSLELLQEYNVFSAKYVYLLKGNKRYIFEYKKSNPCYAYRFVENGEYHYKIYWPLEEKHRKWLFSGSPLDLEGYDQLDLHGQLLVLTKSLKDVICLRLMGINAISLQGEANKLDSEVHNKLSKRFNKIISLYDSDPEGKRGASRLLNQYDIKPIFIPENSGCKDISDYIKLNGLDKGKQLMNKLINE